MIALALALLAVQSSSPDSLSARAEPLLARGDVQAALKLATKNVYRHPDDAKAHILLGRVHYARPVIGRFPALEEFKIAARLDPTDPAPLYWQMKVGFFLGNESGERIAREALLRLFAVSPDYLDAWERFQMVYHSPGIWRSAANALARHGNVPIALERRAELLIAVGDGNAADSLLGIVVGQRPATTKTYLLRAEANVLAGRPKAAYAWHDSALAHAEADSVDALWEEVWLIASPDEEAQHDVLRPEERRTFFERFWEQRDPDLLTPENERISEHYRRRLEARRMYRLLRPFRPEYRDATARALSRYERKLELMDRAGEIDSSGVPGAEFRSWETRAVALSDALRSDSSFDPAVRSGLTVLGLVFVRYGAPDRQSACADDIVDARSAYIPLRPNGDFPLPCSSLDYESWAYYTPQGPLSVRFEGNEWLMPFNQRQVQSASIILSTDRTTVPAPLQTRSWRAVFQSADMGFTDVYYRVGGDSAAVALWSDAGNARRTSGSGLLRLTAPPGEYSMGIDVDSAGVLGRVRRATTLPSFWRGRLAMSSLVLAPTTPGARPSDREGTLRDMPVNLAYSAGVPLASYVEVYGLASDRDGRSRYRVRYSFEPVRSAVAKVLGGSRRPIVLEFDRETESSMARERLMIEPDRVPGGRYRVTVAVTDLVQNVRSESAALDIIIH